VTLHAFGDDCEAVIVPFNTYLRRQTDAYKPVRADTLSARTGFTQITLGTRYATLFCVYLKQYFTYATTVDM